MILTITSENDHLLDVLHKNPETDFGLYLTELKNGVIVGMAVNAHRYDVVFQDTQYSYLPEGSNAIDFQSYCNPLVVLNGCVELFSPLLRERETYFDGVIPWLGRAKRDVDTKPCTITVQTFYIHSGWYRDGLFLLSRYFNGVEVIGRVGHNVQLVVSGDSVFDAFNLLNLVAMFVHLTNESAVHTYVDDGFAAKYVRILTNLERVPYFVFYLFVKRAIKSEKQFLQFKPVFEAYLRDQGLVAELTFYDTHFDRIRYITERLDDQTAVLDVGCGEFKYYRRMNRSGFGMPYFAVDTDPAVAEFARKLLAQPENESLRFIPSLDDFVYDAPVNIILTEVIEHNTLEDARALIKRLLGLPFKSLFITTPNRAFNVHYQLTEGAVRHDDHRFELDIPEFRALIGECLNGSAFSAEYFGTGDVLNDIQPTQGVVIRQLTMHTDNGTA